jgi:uncharacterized SAM-binding protein YcdF (DUF218 family)
MTKKSLLQKIIILVGVLLLINTVHMLIIQNLHAGLLLLAIIAICVFIYGMKLDKLKKAKWMHIAVAAICLICIVFSAFLSSYGRNDTVQYNEDAVIILGAGIRGEEPGRALTFRLNRALEYHMINPDAIFVVSGGQGPQEAISEALAMERYLIGKGIPAEQIIREELSTSTYENFLFSRVILEEKFPEGFSAAFATNYFHVYRAERIAEYAGLSASHMGAGISWYSVPVNYLREMMAVLQLWIFPSLMTR